MRRAFPYWSQYLLINGKKVKGFTIYLPNPGLLPQTSIPAGKIKGYSLTLIAGGKGKFGSIIGFGFRMPGVPGSQFQQVWRMDYHPSHFPFGKTNAKKDGSEIAAWADGPYHYHVMYPGQ